MNQPTNPGRNNQKRIREAAILLENTSLKEGDGPEFYNPDRRFICRFFLANVDNPTAQIMWDAYQGIDNNY